MFGSRTVLAAIGAVTLGAMSAVAQTDAQRAKYTACGASIKMVNPVYYYYWEYDDPALFNVTYSYDPTYCDSTIPVNFIRLQDAVGGGVYTCSRQQFAPERKTIYSQCTLTHGDLAIQARDEGYNDWSMNFNFGSRALLQYATYSDAFYIEPPPSTTPAPVASGTMQKRKNSESQHKFDCPTGQTYCWTGERQEYACMDTSADVTACGRCPYAPGSESDGPGDCTSIESADDVQCVNSKCVVNACQRGFQVSLDRTKCLDGKKRSIIARGILF